MKSRVILCAILALAVSACRSTPHETAPLPVAETTAQSAEPDDSVPAWIGEPLSWQKLTEIEAWLATQTGAPKGYWQIEGELQLALGRFELAGRETGADKTTPTTLQSKLRSSRVSLERVAAEPEASPSQQKRARDGIARVDKRLGAPEKVADVDVPMISRREWGAGPPHPGNMDKNTGGWKRITVHHSADREPPHLDGTVAASAAAVRSIQKAHVDGKETHFGDIGYHFLIDPYGKVFQGRDLKYQGAHASGDNNVQNIGICMIGNFDEEHPTDAALASLRKLLDELRNEYKIPRNEVFTHKDLKNTACPGRYLAPWVAKYKNEAAALSRHAVHP